MLRATLLAALASLIVCAHADAWVYWVNDRDAHNGSTPSIGRGHNDGSAYNVHFIPSVPAGTQALAINDKYIYWGGYGGIGRANIGSSSVNQDFLTGQGDVTGLATAGNRLYWATTVGNSAYVRSSDEDGNNINSSLIAEDPGFFSSDLAISGSYLFRQRFQNGNVASADLFRTDLDGGNSDGGHYVSPTTHNAFLRGTTATSDRLYAIRVGQGPGADASYPITSGTLTGDSFSQLIAGDGLVKYGLGQVGCRLYWGNDASGPGAEQVASINSALIDGTDVHKRLMTSGVVNPGAVAADLKGGAASECAGTTAPPIGDPIVDPTPPAPGLPSPPLPKAPPPTPVVPEDLNSLTDAQLNMLEDQFYDLLDDKGVLPTALSAPYYRVTAEIYYRIRMSMGWCRGEGCLSAGFGPTDSHASAASAKPRRTTLFTSSVGGSRAKSSRLGYSGLAKAFTTQRRAQKALAVATAKVTKLRRTGTPGARKRAAKDLAKAKAAVAKLHLLKVKLVPTRAGRAEVAAVRRQLKRGKAVKVVLATRVTDPLTGKSVTRHRTVRIAPPKR